MSESAPIRPASWCWTEGELESCGFCWQAYALELEVRCGVCDRPCCAFCVGVLASSRCCPECAPADGAAQQARAEEA